MSSTEASLHEAVSLAHHLEQTLLSARIERLTAVIREHGLQLPETDALLGASDGEHLEACRQVVVTAYSYLEDMDTIEAMLDEQIEKALAFKAALAYLRSLVGSGMELVGGERWRP